MYNRFYQYFKENEMFFLKQFGFQVNDSASHAIFSSLKKGQVTLRIFIDLSKAFDTVNHSILLHKLELCRIKGKCLKLFKSYLKHRPQFVSLGKYENSICGRVTCCVPQDSIVGPLLFVIYINDLYRSSSKLTPIVLADDINLFISDGNINLFETMDEELRKVANWFKANKLSLNISNTKYSLFHSTRKRNEIPNILPPLHVDNVPVKRELVPKFLGVYLDENISWKHHINIVSTKVCNSIGILYRTRCILSKFLRKQLYFSFIFCYFYHANLAWACTNKSKLQVLCRYQKHAARIIGFKGKFTSEKPLLEQRNAMTVYEMNIFQALCFMYLCKNGSTPMKRTTLME